MTLRKILVLFISIPVLSALILFMVLLSFNKESPPLDTEVIRTQWWGAGLPQKEDDTIRSIKISASEKLLTKLKSRLEDVNLVPPLEGVNFEYGINTNALKTLINYWLTKYNWKEREAHFNKYPHFKTKIQGLDIHYMHVKPKVDNNVKVLPLIMIHGWPSSFIEFNKMIPELTTPRPGYDFVFEIIVPSIPGCGFSQASLKPDFAYVDIASIFGNLMNRLGFQKYYIHGGDFGVTIGQYMGDLFPNDVLGHHSNLCFILSLQNLIKSYIVSLAPSYFVPKGHEHQISPLKDYYGRVMAKSGYVHLQMTRPDTPGVALGDSPAGLAAYVLDKYLSWNNENSSLEDGGMTTKFTYEQLLDNIMIYYISNTITTSMRLYIQLSTVFRMPVTIPMACAKFPNDPIYYTDWQLKQKYINLLHSTDLPRGTHFVALEEPELLTEDIFSAIRTFQNFHQQPENMMKKYEKMYKDKDEI